MYGQTAMEIAAKELEELIKAAESPQSAINELKQDLSKASVYGVSPELSDNDATTYLNEYFAALKDKGIRYAWFDKPHNYQVSGILANTDNIKLFGLAQINSSNRNNFGVHISDTYKSFDGKINSYSYASEYFKQFKAAIAAARPINVCVWGDSISTGGSDCIGISYGNPGTNNFSQNAPNGIVPSEGYYNKLIDLITTTFPEFTFNFYNRSIGGTNLQEWNTNKTFGGVTKPWIEHIQDTSPDILIIAFGMNNDLFNKAKSFKYSIKEVMDYIESTFSPVPDFAFITTPTGYRRTSSEFPDFENHQAREMSAHAIRTYAKQRGAYIIDVNKKSNIERLGVNYQNPYFQELAVTYEDMDKRITGNGYTKNGFAYQFQVNASVININVLLKDFVFEFDAKFSVDTPTSEILQIFYNDFRNNAGNEEYWNISFIYPKNAGTTFAKITNFSNAMDSTNWGGTPTANYDANVSWNDDVYRTIRVQKSDDLLEIYVNGVRAIRDRIQLNNVPGTIYLKKVGGVGTFSVQNLKIYEGKYTSYMPTLTEEEMFGEYETGVYTTKSPNGGNGINHPSSIGLQRVYMPALKEFVDDISKI